MISYMFFQVFKLVVERDPVGALRLQPTADNINKKIRYIESYLTIIEEEPISLVFCYFNSKGADQISKILHFVILLG